MSDTNAQEIQSQRKKMLKWEKNSFQPLKEGEKYCLYC